MSGDAIGGHRGGTSVELPVRRVVREKYRSRDPFRAGPMSSTAGTGPPVMSSPAPARPRVVDLAAQPYVFVRDTVSMTGIPRIADRLPAVVMELAAQGVGVGGAPFFRYLLIDMPDRLDMEAGVPVDSTEGVALVGDLQAGLLPAGRYATRRHHGHPAGLQAATADLLAWGEHEGLRWDREATPEGERWGCRLERYLTDPRIQPDMAEWETELSFRLAG
jgi:hypothetical protein